jgi:hypothetical protein
MNSRAVQSTNRRQEDPIASDAAQGSAHHSHRRVHATPGATIDGSGSRLSPDRRGFGGDHVGQLADIVMFNANEGVAVGIDAIIRRMP